MRYHIPFLVVLVSEYFGKIYFNVHALNLTILHTNDVHCRFVSYNKQTRPCSQQDIVNKTCWGGAARRMTLINKLKAELQNVLLLDAGDQYQGTVWFTTFGWLPIAQYMNIMKYDAMCLGNHEFDHGVNGLTPFLKNITTPIVDSNIECKNTSLDGLFSKYLLFRFKNKQGEYDQDQVVAVIGYSGQDIPEISSPGPLVHFQEETESLNKIVAELTTLGINKIIAVGHSGINTDRKICKQVKGVDVVVGGHTNTFLYTGEPLPSTEIPEGPYPEVYNDTGSPCLVVQAFAYGKYLGLLNVDFDDHSGRLTAWHGNPILVDLTFPENDTLKQLLGPYAKRLVEYEKTVVGTTEVKLDSTLLNCKRHECVTGNVVIDAFVDYFNSLDSSGATSVTIGLMNSGGLRDLVLEPGENITMGDLSTLMPFSDTVQKIKLRGRHLLEAMEHSIEILCEDDTRGKFLQVAGIKVTYDIRRPSKQRVVELLVAKRRTANSSKEMVYEPIQMDEIYDVISNSYIIEGGNGFTVIKKNILYNDVSEYLDLDVLAEYLKKHSPLKNQIEGRIKYVTDESKLCSGTESFNILSTSRHWVACLILISIFGVHYF